MNTNQKTHPSSVEKDFIKENKVKKEEELFTVGDILERFDPLPIEEGDPASTIRLKKEENELRFLARTAFGACFGSDENSELAEAEDQKKFDQHCAELKARERTIDEQIAASRAWTKYQNMLRDPSYAHRMQKKIRQEYIQMSDAEWVARMLAIPKSEISDPQIPSPHCKSTDENALPIPACENE